MNNLIMSTVIIPVIADFPNNSSMTSFCLMPVTFSYLMQRMWAVKCVCVGGLMVLAASQFGYQHHNYMVSEHCSR